MSKKRSIRSVFALALILASLPSCNKLGGGSSHGDESENPSYYYLNRFSRALMEVNYLWNEEISSTLTHWDLKADPYAQVHDARYHDAAGNEVDHWTQMIPDYEAFVNGLNGVSAGTYAVNLQLMYADETRSQIVAVVLYTYADGPARKAGLKRGDVIMKVNGATMTVENYSKVLSEALNGAPVALTLYDGRNVTLPAAVEMYENPVGQARVFDCGGRKAGYLFYSSFTLESYADLIEACRSFRQAGVTDLILDLRYNTGGYVLTEEMLASMIAPEASVRAGELLATEVYNSFVERYLERNGLDTRTFFRQDFEFTGSRGEKYSFSTADANIGCQRVFALVGEDTASASEALLCSLKPYMPVYLIGTKTHGKYCAGIVNASSEYFEEARKSGEFSAREAEEAMKHASKAGLYLMVSRYADKNGVTLSMPDGMRPDERLEENPLDGFQLGDPEETLLSRALALCGYQAARRAKVQRAGVPRLRLEPVPDSRPKEGYMVKLGLTQE